MVKREVWQNPRIVFILVIVIGLAVFYQNVQYSGRAVDDVQPMTKQTEERVIGEIIGQQIPTPATTPQPTSATTPTPIPEPASPPSSGVSTQGTAADYCKPAPIPVICSEDERAVGGSTTCQYQAQWVGFSVCANNVNTRLAQICAAITAQAQQLCEDGVDTCDALTIKKVTGEPPNTVVQEISCEGSNNVPANSLPSCTATDPNGNPLKYTYGPNKGKPYVEVSCSAVTCSVYCNTGTVLPPT